MLQPKDTINREGMERVSCHRNSRRKSLFTFNEEVNKVEDVEAWLPGISVSESIITLMI